MKNGYIMVVLLLLVTTLVYWQVSGHAFIDYDDPIVVYQNSHVISGLTFENIRWAFSSTHYLVWYPLTLISHMLDVQLFGLTPRGHHLVNLLLHLLNTALVFGVLRQLTGAFWKSLFVASLFALHPMHVESVAWITERKDLLSTFFWLLTLGAYVKYTEKPTAGRYLPVSILFACSLMSKPTLLTLPLVLLLFDYWPLNRISGMQSVCRETGHVCSPPRSVQKLLLEKVPLLFLAVVVSAITLLAQKSGKGLVSLESAPWAFRFANASVSYMKYIGKMLWPADLSIMYPLGKRIDSSELVVAIVLLGLVSWAVFRFGKKYPYLPVGWLLFIVTLLPVIGLVQVGEQAMADRYTYVSYTGLFIMIVWGMADVAAKWHLRKVVLGTVSGIVLVSLSVVAWKRAGYWKSTLDIFGQAVTVAGDFYVAQGLLGTALLGEMRIAEAIDHLETAIRDRPDFAHGHYNLGNAREKTGNISHAIASFSKAILFKPDFKDAYLNRAILYLRLKEYAKAKADLITLLDSNSPQSEINHCTPEETNFLLGKTYSDTGDQEKAIAFISRAISLNPTYYLAYFNRGVAYKRIRRMESAAADFTIACQGGNMQACTELNALKSSATRD